MTDYCSWVPTVGGRLSFSIIGDSQHNEKTTTLNHANNDIRYLVCIQRRELLDSSIPFLKRFLASSLFSLKGTFEFLLIAEAPNNATIKNAMLNGVLCFFPTASEGWKNSKASIIEYIETLENNIGKEDFSKTFKNQLDTIITPVIENNSSFFAQFELSRNGIVKINIPADLNDNNNIPPAFIESKHGERYASAQLFFFLKDISHVHQHHHGRTDTIIDIHSDDDNHTWRQQTIRSLSKSFKV